MIRRDLPPGPVSYTRGSHAAWRRIGDETVVLDPHGHRLLGLNEPAGAIWHRLDAPRSIAELVAALALPARDVESFLTQLVDLGLAESSTAGHDTLPDDPPSSKRVANDCAQAPAITWQEPLQNAAQSAGGCAFLSGQNPLCNSAPFS